MTMDRGPDMARECAECGNALDEHAAELGLTICGRCRTLDERDISPGDWADEIED